MKLVPFQLTAFSDSQVLFDDLVEAVSAVNPVGAFDLLAGHEDMLTTLEGPVTLRLSDGKTQEIPSRSGVISCHAGQVIMYLDVAA